MGPVINRAALDKIHSYTEIGKSEGAELLTGGEIATENGLDKGFFYRPTVFSEVDAGMRIAQEEIFGPSVALIRASDVDEAIRVSNGVRYGLSSSIFTRDVNKAFKAIRDLKTGITYINAGTTGAEVHLPFGGVKDTGNGHREAGQAALDFYTEWKSVYVDYSGKLQRAQIDNAELYAMLKKINLAEKLSSFEDAFGPRIIGRYNGDKIQVTKVKGTVHLACAPRHGRPDPRHRRAAAGRDPRRRGRAGPGGARRRAARRRAPHAGRAGGAHPGRRARRHEQHGRLGQAAGSRSRDLMDRKLVVFVPREALDPVRDALFAAGAGQIGNYTRCSWYTPARGRSSAARARTRTWASPDGSSECRSCGSRRSIPRSCTTR